MTDHYPKAGFDDVGWLTVEQMVEVDRIMIEDLRIDLVQMMENAGRNLARLVLDRFAPRSVTLLAGAGGNGGGGMVAARHLFNQGVEVSVTLGQSAEKLAGVPAHQHDILERIGVPFHAEPLRAEVVLDALIGYGLRGAPRGRIGELIDRADSIADSIVSLDTPSGLDTTDGSVPGGRADSRGRGPSGPPAKPARMGNESGKPRHLVDLPAGTSGTVIGADVTMTLAMPKVGLRHAMQVGELYVADISVPPSVYDAMSVGPAPDFAQGSIVELVR